MTNRPQETRDFDNVPIFNLMKLSRLEVDDFLNKNVEKEVVKSIIQHAINSDNNFMKIVSTPLILSRLIEIVSFKGMVPKSEGEIIGEFLNCLFQREKEEKQDERLDIKKVTYLLRMIAFKSLESKSANAGLSETEVLKYCSMSMDLYRFNYDSLYALSLILQLGIMEKRESMFVFAHQAYQDYYYGIEELAVLQL